MAHPQALNSSGEPNQTSDISPNDRPTAKPIPVGILVSVSGKKPAIPIPQITLSEKSPQVNPSTATIVRAAEPANSPTTTTIVRTADVGKPAGWFDLLKRYAPAIAVSSVVHCGLILGLFFLYQGLLDPPEPADAEPKINTRVEEAETASDADEQNLDSDLVVNDVMVELPETKVQPEQAAGVEESVASTQIGTSTGDLSNLAGFPSDDVGGSFGIFQPDKDGMLGQSGMQGLFGLPTEVQRRLKIAGGKSGQIQLTLVWNNRNDLDLHCIDPNGEEIFYGNRKAARGSEGNLRRGSKCGSGLFGFTDREHLFSARQSPQGQVSGLRELFCPARRQGSNLLRGFCEGEQSPYEIPRPDLSG